MKLFSIENISKSGAKFNLEKAKWFNHQYIQMASMERLLPMFEAELAKHGVKAEPEFLSYVAQLMRERVHFIPEFWEQTSYFFVAPTEYDPQAVKKRWKPGTAVHLRKMMEIVESVQPFNKEQSHDLVMEYVQGNELNMGAIMNSFRIALVGAAKGPDLFEIIYAIGVTETARRVERAIQTIEP